MNHTRILVRTQYTNNDYSVNLIAEDGSIYKRIDVGVPFYVSNQMREWNPVYNYADHKIHLEKYGNRGNVIEEVIIPRNRKILWALTSGAARNGLIHMYREPKDELDAAFQKLGVRRYDIEIVDNIDTFMNQNGCCCHHVQHPYEYFVVTDGNKEIAYEGDYVRNDHPNQFHRGCKAEADNVLITDGTYAMEFYREGGSVSSSTSDRLCRVVMTKNVNRKEVYEAICRYYGSDKFITE